jgi:hypothetical protein
MYPKNNRSERSNQAKKRFSMSDSSYRQATLAVATTQPPPGMVDANLAASERKSMGATHRSPVAAKHSTRTTF